MHDNDKQNSKIIRYKPNNLATMNTVNNSINILISGEENNLNLHESYLEIEFMVVYNAGGIMADGDNVRLINYDVVVLYSSIGPQTLLVEYIGHCHLNLLIKKLLITTNNEYESGFV